MTESATCVSDYGGSLRPRQRTLKYASVGVGRTPCISSHLRPLATKVGIEIRGDFWATAQAFGDSGNLLLLPSSSRYEGWRERRTLTTSWVSDA